jgi:hypothetical protein
MPYELIRHKFGINTAFNWGFFGLEGSYPGIMSRYSKNIPGIRETGFIGIKTPILSDFDCISKYFEN